MKVVNFEQIRKERYRKIFCPRPIPHFHQTHWRALLPVTALPTTETSMDQTDAATDRFIHAENIILFRRRLAETISAAQRLQLLRLLGEEEAKRQLPPKQK